MNHERPRPRAAPAEKADEMIDSGEPGDGKSIAAWTLWRLRERA